MWTIEPHKRLDKRFVVTGPGDVTLYVDYDDVDRDSVDAEIEAMVATLNEHHVSPRPAVCDRCGGSGEIVLNPEWPSGHLAHSEKCSDCGGSGRVEVA